MPPREMRMNFLPSARAMDLPSDVLPVPGGPAKHSTEPLVFPIWDLLSTASFTATRTSSSLKGFAI